MTAMTLPIRYLRAIEAMPNPDRTGRVRCISAHGFHDVAYVDWGHTGSTENILCVHGLTRNGRDFDALAARLSKSARVICPDLAGRGQSDWLDDASDYHLLQYNMDMTVLTNSVGFKRFDWIGSSLGGLMGISLAAMRKSPIRRLIVNDVGPTIPHSALRRICGYAGISDSFATLEEIEAHLRVSLAPFRPMTDDDWARMTVHSSLRNSQHIALHNDPGIMENFRRYAMFFYFSLWRQWEQITCPVLVLRGAESDFLPRSLLDQMIERLPHAEAIEFQHVGHTPTLNVPEQIDPVVEWLEKTSPLVEKV